MLPIRLNILVCLIVSAGVAKAQAQTVVVPETPYGVDSASMTVTSTALLDADSVFIATTSAQGTSFTTSFLVVNMNTGAVELPLTPLPGTSVNRPTVAVLSAAEVMIAVGVDLPTLDIGQYFVVNPLTGAVVRGPFIFTASGTGLEYRLGVVDPSTVLIAYRSDDRIKGKFTVINPQTGTITIPETTFAPEILMIDVATLDARRVVAMYNTFGKTLYGVIDPQTGAFVKGPAEVAGLEGNVARILKLNSSDVFVNYYSASDASRFIRLNTVTGQKSEATTYASPGGIEFSMSPSLLGTNAVFLPFSRLFGAEEGQFTVYDLQGSIVIPETSYNPGGRVFFGSSTSSGCRVLMAYSDGTDGAAKFQVIDFSDLCAPPPPCPDDVSTQVNIFRSPFTTFFLPPFRLQLVLVHNPTPEPIPGPLVLQIDELQNAFVFAGSTTRCASAGPIPFVAINSGADNQLSSGEVGFVFLLFFQFSEESITYTPRVLGGVQASRHPAAGSGPTLRR